MAVKSIVSTPLADAIAAHYGVEMRSVLTGFKWIGDQIANLEAAGEMCIRDRYRAFLQSSPTKRIRPFSTPSAKEMYLAPAVSYTHLWW